MKTASILSLALLASCGSKPPAENATDASTADTGKIDTGDLDNTETGDTETGDTDNTETGDTDNTETGDTDVELTPEQGNYQAVLRDFENDDCAVKDKDLRGYTNGDHGFNMILNADGLRSTLFYPEQTTKDTKQCTMTGTAYSCEIQGLVYEPKEFDATFVFVQDHTGQWDTNKQLSGEMQYRISCTGKECDTANEEMGFSPILPCKTSISYAGVFK